MVLAILVATAVCLQLGACSPTGQVRVTSIGTGATDAPTLGTAVYLPTDTTSAEFYLTDLPAEALEPGADLSNVSGRLVQVRLLIAPSAGDTPIATSAVNSAIRHVVLARGAVGIYSGGGFFLPSGRPGDASVGGELRDGTVKLTGRRGPFVDRLGAARFDATFTARRDDAVARRLDAVLRRILMDALPADAGPGRP